MNNTSISDTPFTLDTTPQGLREWLTSYYLSKHPQAEPSVWYTTSAGTVHLSYHAPPDGRISFTASVPEVEKLIIDSVTCYPGWEDYARTLVQDIQERWMAKAARKAPTAFISYAWESEDHRQWVRDFSSRLRHDGVDACLDQWEVHPSDVLTAFMERSVRENDFVLIICTPKYREKSDQRSGGVGYEGDIMTGEVLTEGNQRKFIPVLRNGDWKQAAATWLKGKCYVDLRGDPYSEESYQELRTTLLGMRTPPPPIRGQPSTPSAAQSRSTSPAPTSSESLSFEPIRIGGVIVDEVGRPRDDGTRGSALYTVPFQLSRRPPRVWADLFIAFWNRPPHSTSMHRPGIAKVIDDRIVLDGTTIDEVEKYHRDTLVLAADRANEEYAKLMVAQRAKEATERTREEARRANVDEVARRIKFD